ncbi:Acyl-CoA synthetase (NDP forming) [Archaeoglobus sulfaticallidus PM70-1]|uniref:acetate--CoA ligase (ADP-forming) n=1 Tax=Archaeoglobus sulfaticallidus PM70-1 TaxID=387631 RepID=N0BB91_9EURY|nr:acetate--CoA ligase [Archaeoglobus sulfaticallidus]AGK60874.1 Acyl-CoA synthetase (NDP forming) [Archaeoglobus sulfaticallidus PM70-1]
MKFLMENEVKDILEDYGIKTAKCLFARDEDEAVEYAKQIGYPVVMKVASRKIIHKSDVGGVLLNLNSEEEVRQGFRKLISIKDVEGVNVQPALKKGIEVIVGVSENEQFGSVVMFGLGGVFVEVLKDVSMRLLPLSRKDAEEMVKEIKGYRLLEGYRNYKGDVKALVDLLLKLNDVVEEQNIIEMDLNPIFVYEDGYAVADARAVVGKRREFDRVTKKDLHRLFYPESVAIIGASRTVGKPGYNIVWNLKQHGFRGRIYPVNPNADKILDYKCYPSILDIPDEIDMAIIAVPAKLVPQVMEQCAEKHVKGAVIVSSGFSEEGEIGAEYERRVLEIAKSSGIRIFGPNTTGVLNTDNGFITTFAKMPIIKVGDIGIVAQTGLFLGIIMAHVATSHPSIGFSKIVGMGNKIDVEDYEVLDFLLDDEKTKVIGMYIEGLKNGRSFYEISREAEKPIVVFKSGRSDYGKKAAMSHTASICGDDEVFSAMCKQANITRVYSFEEMFNVTKAFSLQPLPSGDNVALIHYTGSGCVQGADAIYFNNLKLAELSEETVKKIEEVTPEWHRVNNPLDIWPMVEYYGPYRAYDTAINALLSDENVDSLVVAMWAGIDIGGSIYNPDFKKIKEYGKPVYFVAEGLREGVFETKNRYEFNGFPVYPDIITAVNVLGKVSRYARRWD